MEAWCKDDSQGRTQQPYMYAPTSMKKRMVLVHNQKSGTATKESTSSIVRKNSEYKNSETLGHLGTQTAENLIQKSVRLHGDGHHKEAIRVYDELIHRYKDDTDLEIRRIVAIGLQYKGVALKNLQQYEEAIGIFDELIYRYGDDIDPELQRIVAKGLVNKGVYLGNLPRYKKAIGAFDKLTHRYGDDIDPELQQIVAKGLVNKGIYLGNLDQYEEAIKVYNSLKSFTG